MTLQDYDFIYQNPTIKKMQLEFSNGVIITNSEICSEEMSLEESLCSEEYLKFGTCESACFKVRIVNSDSFKGQTVVVKQKVTDTTGTIITDIEDDVIDNEEDYITFSSDEEFGLVIPYGTFKVYEDVPSNDRMWRDLTCYDAMYDIINADVSTWYESLTFPMTIKQLRDSFFLHLGITQKPTTLINDSLVVEGNFIVEGTLAGKAIIEAICELNGVFGHISRDNKFEYIGLPSSESISFAWYIDGSGRYEDYETDAITGIIVRTEANDVGITVGDTTNPYVISDNPLTYGLAGTPELTAAITNLLTQISQIVYRPFEVETYGNPMLPVGTNVVINTKKYDPENGYQPFTINSFVNRRELIGIQALRDVLITSGEKHQIEQVNSIQSDLKRTKGKMHVLENTVDTFKSEITNIESMVAYSVTMRSASTFPLTVMDNFLTEEEYENLIGTETFIANHDIDTYYPANKYMGKYVLETNGGGDGLPILYSSDGTDWNVSKQATTPLSTQSNTRIWEHESQDNDKLIGFALEDNLNYLVAVRLNADITPSANGLCLQFDLPGLSNSVNRTCIRPVYKQGSPFTTSDILSDRQLIYLQYIPYSDISDGPNPYGFKYVWNMLEDNIQRNTSLIEQLSNEIVLKVDSNGYLSEVNLHADADEGSSIDLKADNINFTSFNLNMQTNGFKLTSDAVTIDENGLEIASRYYHTLIQSNKFLIENPNDDAVYTSIGIGELNISAFHHVPNYSDYHTFNNRIADDSIKIYDTTLNKGIIIETNDIYLSTNWAGFGYSSLNAVLSSLANIGNIIIDEPNAVSVGNSSWTRVGSVILPSGRWLIVATARFASNNTGRRGILISTSSSVSSADNAVGQLAVNSSNATSGSYTYVQTHWITSNLSSSTTFYLQAWQNSGSALSTLPRIRAVRIR